jgi:hypothetical protein
MLLSQKALIKVSMRHIMSKYNIRHHDYFSESWSIRSPYFFCDRDDSKRRLHQHIHDEDYFGTLATRLTMMSDLIKTKSHELQELYHEQRDIVDEARDELAILQENYTIRKKD